jgi:hypothetical protein
MAAAEQVIELEQQ